MSSLLDIIRSNVNSLKEKMSDPVKLSKLRVADLEKAVADAKEGAALVVGLPETIKKELTGLRKQDAQYTARITSLLESGEEGEALAEPHIVAQATLQETIEEKEAQLAEAEADASDWMKKVAFFEEELRKKKSKTSTLDARSKMANAETKLGKLASSTDALMNDSTFDDAERQITEKEQKAAGYSKMSGLDNKIREKELINSSRAQALKDKYKRKEQ